MSAPQVGDVITTVEQLDALPRGTLAVGDEGGTWPTPWLTTGSHRGRSGLKVWDDLNSDGNQPLRTSAQVLERNRSVTVVFVPGHLPRPERVVKAEALRHAAHLVDAECPHEPDEHAEGSCDLCDFTFAVTAEINERADRIEAGETR